MIETTLNNALTGIQRGMSGLERNAASIAQAATGQGDDIVQPLVESKLNKLQVESNVKVLKTQDDMLGSLLDEMA